jgi:hypothetical protein
LDAEEIAEAVLREGAERLASLEDELRVALVVSDDAQGGWTHRVMTEAQGRFLQDATTKRGWAVATFWSSETPDRADIRAEVLASVHRTLRQRRHGLPKTLRAAMSQEGDAAAFAGSTPQSDVQQVRRLRTILEPHLASASYPVIVAAMYGDEGARSAGYPPLGVPPRGGFEVALANAIEAQARPEASKRPPISAQSFGLLP